MADNRTLAHHSGNERKRRKYVIIAKVDKYTFVKYRCNDLAKFFPFLVQKFPGAMFANVFSNRGHDRRSLVYTWGSKKGLEPAK